MKFARSIILTLVLMLSLATVASATPLNQDFSEPANNSPLTTYQFSQNEVHSWIQSPTDIDFWNFVSPKTVVQQIWLQPPSGTFYELAIFEYPGGSSLAHVFAYGGTASLLYVYLQAGKKYSIMIKSHNGSYDDTSTNFYTVGLPGLF
ncbi:hypothetical protein [Paenibacillus sp. KS-LC4]|uniref:hypothetical protein n=1 Tax=Paenibacillus sp. KS-LC4 TaxID=2979727 RepID=UPI0030CD54B5